MSPRVGMKVIHSFSKCLLIAGDFFFCGAWGTACYFIKGLCHVENGQWFLRPLWSTERNIDSCLTKEATLQSTVLNHSLNKLLYDASHCDLQSYNDSGSKEWRFLVSHVIVSNGFSLSVNSSSPSNDASPSSFPLVLLSFSTPGFQALLTHLHQAKSGRAWRQMCRKSSRSRSAITHHFLPWIRTQSIPPAKPQGMLGQSSCVPMRNTADSTTKYMVGQALC